VVHKKPTPIQIVQVDYPARSRAKITEAYFRQASTTDYNGVYKGYYLDFEAKETTQKTSFPFNNFHQHQIDHMRLVLKQNGIAFTRLYFSRLNRLFYYPAEHLLAHWDKQERKSILLSDIEREGYELTFGFAPAIPYLEIVDSLVKGDDSH